VKVQRKIFSFYDRVFRSLKKSVFICLRTLTTWYCPLHDAGASANLQQRVCCCGPILGQTEGQTDRHLPFRRPCSSYYASSAKLPIISSARFVIVLICQFVDPLALSSNRIGQSRCDSQPVRRYVQNSRRHGLVFMLRRLRSNHSFCQSFVSRVSHQPRNRPSLFLELPPSTVADSMRPF